MEPQNCINFEIITTIVSALVGIISVCIAIYTLKQNSKMIEESTRPYVVIYLANANFQNSSLYLVVKNFGQTGATIKSFQSSLDLSTISHDGRPLFKGIENSFIAPKQSYKTAIDISKLPEDKEVEFTISYSSKAKAYNERFKINLNSFHNILSSRASTEHKELKIISYTLQDLVERFL